jgi:hypothetical protein
MPVMRLTGHYRIKGVDGSTDEVWISDAGFAHSISEAEYRRRKLQPPLDELPKSREEYLAQQHAAAESEPKE